VVLEQSLEEDREGLSDEVVDDLDNDVQHVALTEGELGVFDFAQGLLLVLFVYELVPFVVECSDHHDDEQLVLLVEVGEDVGVDVAQEVDQGLIDSHLLLGLLWVNLLMSEVSNERQSGLEMREVAFGNETAEPSKPLEVLELERTNECLVAERVLVEEDLELLIKGLRVLSVADIGVLLKVPGDLSPSIAADGEYTVVLVLDVGVQCGVAQVSLAAATEIVPVTSRAPRSPFLLA